MIGGLATVAWCFSATALVPGILLLPWCRACNGVHVWKLWKCLMMVVLGDASGVSVTPELLANAAWKNVRWCADADVDVQRSRRRKL